MPPPPSVAPLYLLVISAFALAYSATSDNLADTSPLSLTVMNQSLIVDPTTALNYSDPHPILIEHCEERTVAVVDALTAANLVAHQAASISAAGIQIRAYKAMFKTNSFQKRVRQYLSMIYDYRGSIDLKPDPYRPTLPRFACATPDSGELYSHLSLSYDPWQRCRVPVRQALPLSFYAEGTVYTFVCPSFFDQPLEPPRRGLRPTGRTCPTVEGNEFVGDINYFYRKYQVYTLFESVVRLYLGKSSLGDSSDPKETFDWNECVEYSGYDSTKNPTNFGLYAALVDQKCTAIPDPEKDPFSNALSSGETNASTPPVDTS